jgi:hypothetical protein
MKSLAGGFHSRRFSRRDLDSSLKGRRISHKKRKSRRKGRGFYGKKSRRKMMGGDLRELQIIVEYNKDATTEDAIGFKIKRIEGGEYGGMGHPNRIKLEYVNCEKTRNDLITTLFGGRINPTSSRMGMNNRISSTTTDYATRIINEIKNVFKYPLSKEALEKGTNFINKNIDNGNVASLATSLLSIFGFDKTKESVMKKIIKEEINKLSKNEQQQNLVNNIKNVISTVNPTKNLPNTSTTILNEPMSKDFKESFKLAMALKMFDENDDAEMVDNSSDGVMGNPGVDTSEYPGASPESIEVLNMVREIIDAEEYVISFNGQENIVDKQNNFLNIQKANEHIKYVKELIHEKYIPNSKNRDTDVNNIINTAEQIINNSSVITDNELLRQDKNAETNRKEEINKAITKLNQLLDKDNNTALNRNTSINQKNPKVVSNNYKQPISQTKQNKNINNINNNSLNKSQDPPKINQDAINRTIYGPYKTSAEYVKSLGHQ